MNLFSKNSHGRTQPAGSSLIKGLLASLVLSVAGVVHAAEPAAAVASPPASPGYPAHVVPNTQVRVLPRSANGRDYQLYVALPASYATSPEKRYPVLYICDGYYDFTLLCGFYGNIVYDKSAPEYILVGFGYPGDIQDYQPYRFFDYSPVPMTEDPKGERTGHAAEFLSVVEREIIPFVEKEYRADPKRRGLGGSSLGGLFTLYTMFTKPELFQGYIAPSPAVIWANGWLFGYEEQFAKSKKPIDARLYMTGAAGEDPNFLVWILQFNERLQQRSYEGLTYRWRLVDDEYHAGTKAESYNRGVRFIFAPWAPRVEARPY